MKEKEKIPSKNVSFSPDTKEEPTPTFTPYQKIKKEPNYARMRKKISSLLANETSESYKAASDYIKSHPTSQISELYHKYGEWIFHNALIYSRNGKELDFWIEIARDTILAILPDLVPKFIRIDSAIEQKKGLTEEELNGFTSKIKSLLELHEHKITSAINTAISQECISEKLKTVVATVLSEKKDHKPLKSS